MPFVHHGALVQIVFNAFNVGLFIDYFIAWIDFGAYLFLCDREPNQSLGVCFEYMTCIFLFAFDSYY